MEMQVNAGQCTGCGLCVEECPTGAIHLSDGLAILDQATCTQCQACVDVCPVGAITVTVVERPVVVTEPAAVQPMREWEVTVAEPVSSSPKPWFSAALAFAGREILPRLADSLIAALDRRLAQSQAPVYPLERQAKLSPVPSRGRCYRRRSRVGRARH
jgi:NAD-dependent dihydropyrimidine dehydrogenase PreA subunit